MDLNYTVTSDDDGEKILTILRKRLLCSGTQVRRLKSNALIFLNGFPTVANSIVKAGDTVSIRIVEHRANDNVPAQDIPMDIIYEDEFVIAVNKPAGMAVHPSGIYTTGTLANALRHHFLQKKIDMTARPVGRLDRNTSGVVLFAKNSHVMSRLSEIYQRDTTTKLYHGIAHGCPSEESGIIDLPIKRAPDSIISRVTSVDGKPSRTLFKVLERYMDYSLIEYRLLTGRTHQVRLHSKEIGCPLAGDGIYGDENKATCIIRRHALHCRYISYTNPFDGSSVEITAPYPEDFKTALLLLRSRSQ